MKLRCFLIIIPLAILFASPVQAARKNWYVYLAIGAANTTYPEPLNSAMNQAESLPGSTRIQLDLDFPGFYFPVAPGTIAGFVINGAADRIDNGSQNIQLNLYTYGVSAMHFFGTEPGAGWFLRGDFGITKAVLLSSFSSNIGSNTGTGFLLGAGYGFDLPSHNQILVNFNYANRTIESQKYKTSSISIGILF